MGAIKMLWTKIMSLFGKVAISEIVEGETRILLWDQIYKGAQEWLNYSYVTLTGHRTKRTRKSMKPAKLLTSEMASLIWAEPPELLTDDSVRAVLDQSRFFENMPAKTDRFLALGGMTLKLYVKDRKIFIDYIPAQRMIPVSWDSGGVTEADFIDKKVINKTQYIRIESHRIAEGAGVRGYEIKNAAFKEVNPGDYKKALLSDMGGYSTSVFIPTPVPLFSYIRNPQENNFDVDSPLGISMYANALDTMESLDIAFDALQSEIILGRKRIIVPAGAVRYITDAETGKRTRYFDPSDEVFQAFSTEDTDNLKIVDNTVSLRISEIKEAIQCLLDILSVQVGFSAGYLSFDGSGGMKTATEVVSENSKTFKTKKSYENEIGRGILQLCEAIRAIAPLYQIQVSKDAYTIKWSDSIIEDRNSKAEYWGKLYSQGLTPLWVAVKALTGLSEKDSKARAAEIKADRQTIDVNSLFGGTE